LTTRWIRWVVGILCVGVIVGVIYLPVLRRRLREAAKLQQQTAEQARRELTQAVPVNPGEPRVKAKLFWASGNGDGALMDSTVELPLSSDPVLRAKQVLNTLLAGPVDADLRTLPPDAVLLAFYILPNGTAIADFSEALATATPSGIQSEQLAVDSITKTLEANVPRVQRLKILIHGQEVETLAGHLDLTGTFLVNTKGVQAATALLAPMATPATTTPSADKPAVPTTDKPASPANPASKPVAPKSLED
jgi:Sporulation and spore germination